MRKLMLRKIMRKLMLAVAALACLCVWQPGNVFAQDVNLMVSAAASLTNAFDDAGRAFARLHPGVKIRANYAASNPLLKQLVEGAPVDVFATADQQTMDQAEKDKVIYPASRKNFAANELVLIVPKGQPKPAKLADLDKMARIVVGAPDSVPAGRYARDALEKARLWDKLQDKMIFASSVRQALAYVARGEADAGFVYLTDARQMAPKVDIAMTVGGHAPILYPVAVAVTGDNALGAEEFIQFLISPAGQAILAKYGFAAPGSF